ncbi:hypothetical protein L227DRAFT_363874 [Lentinus tigrinus ALCF2SS1-6]|uniref:Uncharacterized protein n=1 Tax=Lentinus tigrinus ALCF2SS1-6 TaxID=1328759 RepID=A0A5C2SJ76_9APHY|nr:hypothetical protein L227DRAFT_363874 [Lentinus tigrinus ALCF2SS1-6]
MALRASSLLCWRRRTYSRRTRLFLYAVISTLLLCGAFTAVFLVAGVRSYNVSAMIDEAAGNKDGIALLGHAYNIDVSQRQVQMSWLVLGCGSLALRTGSYHSKACGTANVALDLYVDGATNASGSYDPASNLWFDAETNNSFYIQPSVEFQTEHLLEVTAWHGQDQQYAYPFDTYIFGTVFQAFLSGTNVSVPFLFLRIVDATSSLQPIYIQDADVRTLSLNGSEIVHARGARYSFHRVALSQLFVMVLFIVNWLLTAVVLFIAVSAYDGLPMSEGVLILPVSVILTIPALRALWVDAPSFGLLLDSCGTFLQMVLVSLASLYLVVNVGLRRKEAAQQEQDAKAVAATATAARVELDVEKEAEAEAGLPLLAHHHHQQ